MSCWGEAASLALCCLLLLHPRDEPCPPGQRHQGFERDAACHGSLMELSHLAALAILLGRLIW